MPLDPQKIRHRREKLKLTQGQLAQAAGMSRPRIVELEGGRSDDTRISTIDRIAAALKCRAADLLE